MAAEVLISGPLPDAPPDPVRVPVRRGGQRLVADVIAEYLVHRAADGLAANTVRRDATHLGIMARHVGERSIASLTARQLDAFYVARSGSLAGNSMNTMSTSLRPFFRFCVRRGYIKPNANPLEGRRTYSFLDRPKLRLPVSRFPELLDAADDGRDRILVALGLYTLMRRGELLVLRVGDVDLGAGSLAMVVPKSQLRDELPISYELDAELRRWFEEYAERLGRPLRPTDVLVPRRLTRGVSRGNQHLGGQRMRRATMPLDPDHGPLQAEQVVAELLTRLGYAVRDEEGRSLGEGMHTLRRSGARARFDVLVASGYDGAIREVQSLLHHRSVTTTERYLGLDLDIAKRDANLRGRMMYPEAPPKPPRAQRAARAATPPRGRVSRRATRSDGLDIGPAGPADGSESQP